MRVLMLTQWFDPEPTFKGLLMAQEIERQGHQVSVITGFPNYPGGKVYEGYHVRPLKREQIGGISVIRVPLYPSHDSSGVRRVANYMSFAIAAAVAVLFVKRPDVAYVYHPPATIGLPAWIMKVLRGVPFVYDVQDLWPDTLAATGMIHSSRVLRIAGWVQKRIYRSATHIVVLSDGFRRMLVERGVPERRITVIPNWADEQRMVFSSPPPRPPDDAGSQVRITFAGNMGPAQGLEVILDAAGMLTDLPEVHFVLIGGGVDADALRAEAAARSLSNVEFLPRKPISDIGKALAASDALLVHLRDDPLFEITIPSKTQAYMMAGRPILMGVRGDAARMIEEANAGLVFEPANPTALAQVVRDFVSKSKSERESMGRAGRKHYEDSLSLRTGVASLLQVFDRSRRLKPRVLATKRLIDVFSSALAAAVLCVPMAVCALIVRYKLGSPVLFRQERPGRDGQAFCLMKFRTMSDARDDAGELLPDRVRLTPFGRFLRRTSIDELPTLWNVFRGDMSVVGPRPLLMRYSQHFTTTESARLDVRPGITGWAQVNGRNTTPWHERLAFDVWYVDHLSVALDLKIILLTLARVFRSEGVVTDPESIMQNLDDERREPPQQPQ